MVHANRPLDLGDLLEQVLGVGAKARTPSEDLVRGPHFTEKVARNDAVHGQVSAHALEQCLVGEEGRRPDLPRVAQFVRGHHLLELHERHFRE